MKSKINPPPSDGQIQAKPLRLLPGIIIVILQWLVRFGIPAVFPEYSSVGILGGLAGGLLVILWWAFFSRAPGLDRWGGVLLIIVAMLLTSLVLDPSIKTGMQGLMFPVYSLPVLSLAFVLWAVFRRNMGAGLQRVLMVITIFISCGVWTLVRSDGITGEGGVNFAWRWSETPEERLLSGTVEEPAGIPYTATEGIEEEAEWPGFRGENRDGIIRNVRIETDWLGSPPVELWRQPIGPGCSSFSVRGNLLYTQEQRGEFETVTAYDLTTGKLVWMHQDEARFWDSHAGAGPRGTPTLYKGWVCTLGATGILNLLDADDGSVIWSRNAASDAKVVIPGWGFASSPLVVDSNVIVALAGTLIFYDLDSGEQRWMADEGGMGYSSPQLFSIRGTEQVLFMSETRAAAYSPSDAALLWEYELSPFERILQPAMTPAGELLLNSGGEPGMLCLVPEPGTEGWTLAERWTSSELKSGFNDIVVHEGHAYGFTGPMLACMDLKDGSRKWRGGRYGGQLILLEDQGLLLVLSEKGELALVSASPEGFNELARIPAIEGKTWNHPVLTGDLLVVRNTEEMAAFRLSLSAN